MAAVRELVRPTPSSKPLGSYCIHSHFVHRKGGHVPTPQRATAAGPTEVAIETEALGTPSLVAKRLRVLLQTDPAVPNIDVQSSVPWVVAGGSFERR